MEEKKEKFEDEMPGEVIATKSEDKKNRQVFKLISHEIEGRVF